MKCLRMLTFLPIQEIESMASWEGIRLNEAKDILAFELTKLVHGEDEAQKAREASKALFSGMGNSENMPVYKLCSEDMQDGKVDILTLLVKSGLVSSKSEARRAVEQGGVSVCGEKVTDVKSEYDKDAILSGDFIIKRGKKNFIKIAL